MGKIKQGGQDKSHCLSCWSRQKRSVFNLKYVADVETEIIDTNLKMFLFV